jgi:hypothetical protein
LAALYFERGWDTAEQNAVGVRVYGYEVRQAAALVTRWTGHVTPR